LNRYNKVTSAVTKMSRNARRLFGASFLCLDPMGGLIESGRDRGIVGWVVGCIM
jgi:hypothetical protein